MFKKNVLISVIMFLFISGNIFSQLEKIGFICDGPTVSPLPSTPFGMGLTKPMKTLPSTDGGIQFRVLLVFVEFADETDPSSNWPIGDLPDYAGNLLAPEKELGLNAYEDYLISDYFNRISNDQFDMIGDVVHVVLPGKISDYSDLADAETDVFDYLDNTLELDWNKYDQWSWNSTNQEFEKVRDNYMDMVYVQYRPVDLYGIVSGGFAANMVNYTTHDGKHITQEAISYTGTGVTGINGANMDLMTVVAYFRHEYCHYTLGGHRPYSTIGGGDGTRDALGYELGFAPQDLITVGLANVTTFTGSTNTFVLEDLQTTGDILKVPTSTSGEYFLISNRRRLAGTDGHIWDCNMGGDTALGRPFKQFHDYSKGLYIYHINSGNNYEAYSDLECADGLWDWTHLGTETPDWSSTQTLALLSKTGIGRNDDNPETGYISSARLTSRDGHSVISQTSFPYAGWGQNWFSTGKRHTTLNGQGTDRMFTNLEENWCSRGTMGDRWDAWAKGYNEVFSPYSSPNTKDRSGTQTGIFIYYESLSGEDATIKVYQADANTEDEEVVLEATPPSKPMLYRAVEMVNCNGTNGNPRITWDNNLEPDMVRVSGENSFKRYKIYRASSNLTDPPLTYSYIATYDDYTPNDTANFIDNDPYNGVLIPCSDEGGGAQYWRYKISAVDMYDDESVKSDFVSVRGNWASGPDNKILENGMPKVFSLSQNYPNPFNPTTDIKFELPKDNFVTVKVYNAIGEEVAVLVNNEWKTTGRYSVKFDGSNLASGIYFYYIHAGNFTDTKKMVLIK